MAIIAEGRRHRRRHHCHCHRRCRKRQYRNDCRIAAAQGDRIRYSCRASIASPVLHVTLSWTLHAERCRHSCLAICPFPITQHQRVALVRANLASFFCLLLLLLFGVVLCCCCCRCCDCRHRQNVKIKWTPTRTICVGSPACLRLLFDIFLRCCHRHSHNRLSAICSSFDFTISTRPSRQTHDPTAVMATKLLVFVVVVVVVALNSNSGSITGDGKGGPHEFWVAAGEMGSGSTRLDTHRSQAFRQLNKCCHRYLTYSHTVSSDLKCGACSGMAALAVVQTCAKMRRTNGCRTRGIRTGECIPPQPANAAASWFAFTGLLHVCVSIAGKCERTSYSVTATISDGLSVISSRH